MNNFMMFILAIFVSVTISTVINVLIMRKTSEVIAKEWTKFESRIIKYSEK